MHSGASWLDLDAANRTLLIDSFIICVPLHSRQVTRHLFKSALPATDRQLTLGQVLNVFQQLAAEVRHLADGEALGRGMLCAASHRQLVVIDHQLINDF